MGLPISKYVWFDGKFTTIDKAKVPITTHAIHYGTSVFEGIRAYWNEKNLFIFRLEKIKQASKDYFFFEAFLVVFLAAAFFFAAITKLVIYLNFYR